MNRRKFIKRVAGVTAIAAVAPADLLKPANDWADHTPAMVEADISYMLDGLTPHYEAIYHQLLLDWKAQYGTDCIGFDLEFLKITASTVCNCGLNALELLKANPMTFGKVDKHDN